MKYSEKEVLVQGEYELSATLTIPEFDSDSENKSQKLPAIVIISGTGPADRNGNMKNFNMNIYKQLAEFLSGLGFVTIRYDKRGIGKSKGDHNRTGVKDLVNDIISNIKFLENLPYVDRNKLLLLGHSEGSILSTIVNSKHPVSGLILLAGAGTSLKPVLQAQNLSVVEEIKAMKGLKGKLLRLLLSEKKVIQKQNKLFNLVNNSTEDVIKVQLQKVPAKWLREHLSYTDEEILAMLNDSTCPILAITGDKDIQVDIKDLDKVNALQKENITCRVIKNMDHILREFTGEKSIMNIKKQYKSEFDKPLHDQLQKEIRLWYENNYTSESSENNKQDIIH